jgi:hypothetical protein
MNVQEAITVLARDGRQVETVSEDGKGVYRIHEPIVGSRAVTRYELLREANYARQHQQILALCRQRREESAADGWRVYEREIDFGILEYWRKRGDEQQVCRFVQNDQGEWSDGGWRVYQGEYDCTFGLPDVTNQVDWVLRG